jgi:cyclohexanecarboxylate-CoA ligase
MYVEVDLSSGKVSLADPDNFRQFHVAVVGQGTDDDVAATLRDGGRAVAVPSHVDVAIDLVRRLAGPQVGADWEAGFQGMLAFAKKAGWIDDTDTYVRAHTVWPVVEGYSLWDLVAKRLALTPDLEMACDERGERLTYREFADRAEAVAAGLWERGLRPGDVVSWELPTWLDAMILSAALNRIDIIQNPIIAIYREREVAFCVRQTGAKLLVVPSVFRGFDFTAMARAVSDTTGVEVLTLERGGLPVGDPSVLPPVSPPPTTKAEAPERWYMYTSGTTSDPKGARQTDYAIAVGAFATAARADVAHGDRLALVFPFPHVGGIMWMFASLQYGLALLFEEAFEPARTSEFLSREGCTHPGSGTPFFIGYLAEQRERPDRPLFPRAKVFPGGGAPIPPEMFYDVKRELGGKGIVSGWGLTEAPILSMGSHKDPEDKLARTEGKAMPGVEFKVVTLDDRIALPGEEGELRAKAPQMMIGYVDPELDRDGFDDDGWFRTGDLGVIDDEGYVTITGRLKDVIIRNAENISAKEVEDLLYLHPRVLDVAVIGLPDPKTGERVVAVVAMRPGEVALGFAEMREFLRERGLRMQAVPEQLVLADTIPRTPAGKITKNVLRDRYRHEPFARS